MYVWFLNADECACQLTTEKGKKKSFYCRDQFVLNVCTVVSIEYISKKIVLCCTVCSIFKK